MQAYGVDRCASICQLPDFDIFIQALPDPAHTVGLGIVQKDVKLFFSVIYSNSRLTEAEYLDSVRLLLLEDSEMFPIHRMTLMGKKKLKATHQESVDTIKRLPFVLRQFRTSEIEVVKRAYNLLCDLAEITILLESWSWTARDIEILRAKIERYYQDIVRLYVVDLQLMKTPTPKHHVLRHLPDFICLHGPPRSWSVMRCEGKHTFAKRCFHCSNGRAVSHMVLTRAVRELHLRIDAMTLQKEPPVFSGLLDISHEPLPSCCASSIVTSIHSATRVRTSSAVIRIGNVVEHECGSLFSVERLIVVNSTDAVVHCRKMLEPDLTTSLNIRDTQYVPWACGRGIPGVVSVGKEDAYLPLSSVSKCYTVCPSPEHGYTILLRFEQDLFMN
jgi:hypothetical protein